MKSSHWMKVMAICLSLLLVFPAMGYSKKPDRAQAKSKSKQEVPAGIQKKADEPPKGWSEGEKKGWQGKDAPPGLSQRFSDLFKGKAKE